MKPTQEQLSAYLDGELPEAVEQMLARDSQWTSVCVRGNGFTVCTHFV